jgi:hypothetical protein
MNNKRNVNTDTVWFIFCQYHQERWRVKWCLNKNLTHLWSIYVYNGEAGRYTEPGTKQGDSGKYICPGEH